MKLNSLILLTCTVVALVGCATPAQVVRDRLVDKLCAYDGGVHVHQTVPRALRNRVATPFKQPKETDLFFFKSSFEDIEGSDGTLNIVFRSSTGLYRISDGKLLANYVAYHRRGWDVLRPHPSHYTCPTSHGEDPLLESVFVDNSEK